MTEFKKPEGLIEPQIDAEQLAMIADKLKSGGLKKLIGNRGYRQFLKVEKTAASIDAKRVQEDARYDGKYVLRTTLRGCAGELFRIVGVKVPPLAQPV